MLRILINREAFILNIAREIQPPSEMLQTILTLRFPPDPEEADPVSGEPGAVLQL